MYPGRIRTCAHGSGEGCCIRLWPAETCSQVSCPGAYRARPGRPGRWERRRRVMPVSVERTIGSPAAVVARAVSRRRLHRTWPEADDPSPSARPSLSVEVPRSPARSQAARNDYFALPGWRVAGVYWSRIPFLGQHLFCSAARFLNLPRSATPPHACGSARCWRPAACPVPGVIMISPATARNAAMRGTVPSRADRLANRSFVDI